jgi:hypothetical protein
VAAPPPAKVVLLPVDFDVYELSAGGGREIVKDWTEAARANLSSAATVVLGERAGMQLVPMPELTAQENQALREHLGVVKLIVYQGGMLNDGPWIRRRAEFDRSFGAGLAFLHDKSGADYAVLIDGAQSKQSGGSVFAQVAMAALGVVMMPGSGTYVRMTLLDLEAGQVKWFNQKARAEVLGITGADVRQAPETEQMLRGLIQPYPTIPALGISR